MRCGRHNWSKTFMELHLNYQFCLQFCKIYCKSRPFDILAAGSYFICLFSVFFKKAFQKVLKPLIKSCFSNKLFQELSQEHISESKPNDCNIIFFSSESSQGQYFANLRNLTLNRLTPCLSFMPQILQKVLSSRYFMKIKIQLSNVFEPIVLSLNAYGPLIVAKLPTPTITDQPIATSFKTIGCCMNEKLPKL